MSLWLLNYSEKLVLNRLHSNRTFIVLVQTIEMDDDFNILFYLSKFYGPDKLFKLQLF